MKIIMLCLSSMLIFSACGITQLGHTRLQRDWPEELAVGRHDTKGGFAYNDAQVAAGAIFFRNHDSISGLIKIIPYQPGRKYMLKIPIIKWQDAEDERISKINREDVDSVRIFLDTINRYPSTLFVQVAPMTLWSPIAVRSNTGIYAPSFSLARNGKYYPYLILYSEGQKYKVINRPFVDDVKGKHIRHSLIRFIRRRYAIHKRVKDFKNEKGMFDFILDQEEIRIKKK